MTLDTLKSSLADFAKDIRLNLSTVISEDGSPDLTRNQIWGVALASAYAAKAATVVRYLEIDAANVLSPAEVQAARAAAVIMGMNNVYYRFTHMMSDKEYSRMPARLRMNVIGSPGIDKIDFELYSLAVSAINGCGMCMEAHVHEVIKGGISKAGVQSCIRIAAVVNAAAQAVIIQEQ